MSEHDITTDAAVTPEPTPPVAAEPTPTAAAPAAAPTPAADDPVVERLREVGVSDDAVVDRVKNQVGATTLDDLNFATVEDLVRAGLTPVQARKLLKGFNPSAAAATPVDPTAELGENEEPSKDQVTGFAGMLGADPMTIMLLMNGQGGDMNLSDLVPITPLVQGYNPKLRNLYLSMMGHLEQRLSVPIVVIDADGAINRPLTIEYIEGLEEGREPAENNIYYGSDGIPHEVIRVGVDAQSIYDADPLDPTKALQKSGMGIGRVQWTNVSLEVRQVAFFASTRTRELDQNNDAHLTWLRDHIKPGVTRLVFAGQAPQALNEFNEAARTGSLPTLRVMLSRSPRRPETMPRRRRTTPTDLTAIGGPRPLGVTGRGDDWR